MTDPSASRPGNAAHLVRRLAATLLAVAAGSQATAQHEAAAESFAGLPDAVQQQVVERVAQRLREIPAARRILDLAADCPRPGPAPTSGHHDEKIYAPVAPTRQRIQPGQPLHQKTQQSMPPVLPLQGVAATLVYDWATGRACAAPAQPSAQARFQSLLDGYVPGSDRAAVALLSWIDDDGGQRKVADWFGHLYADRMGRVFVGITLYDAWASGQTVEVPDVDAIAFARHVVGTHSFVSPIPDGRRRDRLYRQIREAFAAYREYRTLREGLALAFLHETPRLPPVYQPLLPRLHHLWGGTGYDVPRVARIVGSKSRRELLEALDAELKQDVSFRDAARNELQEMGRAVRTIALEELQRGRSG
jgi:hypothetical protein